MFKSLVHLESEFNGALWWHFRKPKAGGKEFVKKFIITIDAFSRYLQSEPHRDQNIKDLRNTSTNNLLTAKLQMTNDRSEQTSTVYQVLYCYLVENGLKCPLASFGGLHVKLSSATISLKFHLFKTRFSVHIRLHKNSLTSNVAQKSCIQHTWKLHFLFYVYSKFHVYLIYLAYISFFCSSLNLGWTVIRPFWTILIKWIFDI